MKFESIVPTLLPISTTKGDQTERSSQAMIGKFMQCNAIIFENRNGFGFIKGDIILSCCPSN
jgi:hypothetical protein